MIIDYCILENDDRSEMRDMVIELIREGWEPLGGVNVVCIENVNGEIDTWFAQAMILKSNEVVA